MLSKANTRCTVQQAAEILGVTEGRVRQLLLEKRLKGKKFANVWEVEREEIERFKSLDRPAGNPTFKKSAS